MNMPAFTEDEKLLINSGLSMLGGVIVGTVQGTYQYLTQGGNVSLNGAITFALGGFLTLMGVALRAYVPAHAQQEIQAGKDLVNQLQEALHLATTSQPVVVPSIQQPPVAAPTVSPVTIHISSGGTVSSVIPDQTVSIPPTANTVGTSTVLPGTVVQPQSVQLTMTPAAPTIASTPDLASEDTAVRRSVSIAN